LVRCIILATKAYSDEYGWCPRHLRSRQTKLNYSEDLYHIRFQIMTSLIEELLRRTINLNF